MAQEQNTGKLKSAIKAFSCIAKFPEKFQGAKKSWWEELLANCFDCVEINDSRLSSTCIKLNALGFSGSRATIVGGFFTALN